MKKLSIQILLIFLITTPCFGANCGGSPDIYYVDFGVADDTADGTSTSTPWKHVPGDATSAWHDSSCSLQEGDVVIFKGGVTYTVGSAKQINLSFGGSGDANANRVIYDGDSGTYASRWGSGTGKAIIDGGGNATSIFAVVATKGYITLNNFDMGNIGSGTIVAGAGITDAPYFKVTNNIIHNTSDRANYNGRGVSTSSNNWLIDSNDFHDLGQVGVYGSNSSSNTTVSHNTFNDQTCWGVAFAESGTGTLDSNTFHGNTFYITAETNGALCHGNGIFMWVQGGAGTISNTTVDGNLVLGAGASEVGKTSALFMFQLNTEGASISNTKIFNNVGRDYTAPWFIILNPNGQQMTNSYVYGNTAYTSIAADSGSGFMKIEHSGVANYPNGVYIKNNISKTRYIAFSDQDGSYASWTNVDINNNLWDTSGNWEYPWRISATQLTWANWQALGFDTNGYNEDPKFISTSNLMLQASSNAIDHGATLGSPYNVDFLGNARTTYDIGAYEYNHGNISGSVLSGAVVK